MEDYLNLVFLNNSVESWLFALAIFVSTWIVMLVFKFVILAKLEKFSKRSKNKYDDILVKVLKGLGWPLYAWFSIFASTLYLEMPNWYDGFMRYFFFIVVLYYLAKSITLVVEDAKQLVIEKQKKEDVHDTALIDFFSTIIKGLVWLLAILFFLSNIGVEITTFIAGLGIGGLAVAIALQGVLTDLFASIAIYFDKPFRVGDFIVLGADMGVVQKIGIKTTRIKTLQGQELVISNKELTESRVNNFKRMEKRRIVFIVGVVYGTKTTKLRKIPKIVKEVFDKVDDADLDRVHFSKFNAFSLDFEIVYYVNTSDYNKYMDIQQNVNLDIKERFEKEKIEMAFPTQTLYLKKD